MTQSTSTLRSATAKSIAWHALAGLLLCVIGLAYLQPKMLVSIWGVIGLCFS